MKRLALFLAVMTLTGAGVSYAETNNPIQNFFLGNQQLSGTGFNQVLSLLVGPEGKPGPAGVRGRDGEAGLNGNDGAPGPQGATGDQGPQGLQGLQGLPGTPGRSVVAVQLAAGSTNCPNGGTQLTDGSGVITFVCNGERGAAGATGATGATGAQGAAGTGSGGTSINGTGQISLGTCDDNLNVTFRSLFVADGFILRSIEMTNLAEACNTRKISVFFPIDTSTPSIGGNPNPPYQYGSGASRDYVDCTTDNALSGLSGSSNTITLSTANPSLGAGAGIYQMSCSVRRTGQAVTFSQLYTADVDDNIGFQIAP